MARAGSYSTGGSAKQDPEPKTSQVAGWDYDALEGDPDFLCDPDLGSPLIVENAKGGPYGDGRDGDL
jgi:hypothetical protein